MVWPKLAACEILVPWPGIKPMPPAVWMESLNHWTSRKSLGFFFFFSKQEVDHERSDIMRFTFSQNSLEVQVRQHLTKSFLNPQSYSTPQQRLSYELEKCRLCPSVRQCKWLEYVGSFGKLAMRKTVNLIIYPGISLGSFQFIPQWNPLWLHSCSHPRERG